MCYCLKAELNGFKLDFKLVVYITIPNSDLSPTDLQLTFAFGAGATTARSWNIKVAMLPCGVDYLGKLFS